MPVQSTTVLCRVCGDPAAPKAVRGRQPLYCSQSCRTAYKREYNARYLTANRASINAQQAAAYHANRQERLEKRRAYRQANRDRINAKKRADRLTNPHIRRQQAVSHLRMRGDALRAYGGPTPICDCCGESTPGLLTIDHVGGGGNAHRREIGQMRLYTWLKQHGYPDGFRVLCFNCNMADGMYGCCPHVNPSAGNWSELAAPWTRTDFRARRGDI